MAPARPLKRQKTNPDQQAPTPSAPEQVPLPPDSPQEPRPHPETQPGSQAETTPEPQKSETPRFSWYRTWPRKAAPVTQVVKDSPTTTEKDASDAASITTQATKERRASARSPSLAMTLGKSSNRSLPIDATTTRVHATSDAKSPTRKSSSRSDQPEIPPKKTELKGSPKSERKETEHKDAEMISPSAQIDTKLADPTQVQTSHFRDTSKSGWFSSWRPRANEDAVKVADKQPEVAKDETASTPNRQPPHVGEGSQAEDQSKKPSEGATPKAPVPGSHKRTWMQMLGGDTPSKSETTSESKSEAAESDHKDSASPAQPKDPKTKNLAIPQPQTPTRTSSQASSLETSPPPPLPGDSTKSSGWVFWSRDTKAKPTVANKEQPHVGEIAISDDPSQSKPKRASISIPKDEKTSQSKAVNAADTKKSTKLDAESVKDEARPETPQDAKQPTKKGSKTIKSAAASASLVKEPTESEPSRTASPTPSRKGIEHSLLLPAFHETLALHQNPSILEQLARLLYYTKEPELKHLSLVKDPPRIKNALVIGVHGYFPGTMVRTFLGQPTGTSIKFVDMAAKAIRKWTRSRGYDCQVKTAALEGEGKIAERVELLWKLLLNWIDEIRKTDFVMVACHSQGVPVAIMLIAKLVQFGCINSARVGICAMAGVSMGPFVEYKSRWISGSAGELFEFTAPESKVSKDYQTALETMLREGVRLTFVGSIDDQLVSLESSIFAPISHPHIYRAVHIDSRVHAPNFLSHLVGFVLKLRNLGVQDHGLIRELSSPLAGSLYGDGHSRIYEDDAVYDLAVSFALETNALLGVPLSKRNYTVAGGNPYILPFAMRGILEEDFVKTELQDEAKELLRQFDDWKPTTKVLKDVKFRLEGVRSKL